MKRFTLLAFAFLLSTTGFSQPLSFDELGSELAYCRLYGYQSGNGLVYASPTGGTGPYTYLWEWLETSFTVTSPTWGGLNPGTFKITITDDVGASIVDTVVLDSINPTAIINVVSSGLTPVADGYIGFSGQYVTLQNQSTGFANPSNPIADTVFWWNTDKGYGWQLHQDEQFYEDKYVWYGPGVHTPGLRVQNKNGCTDTLEIQIGIFGPAVVKELNGMDGYLLMSDYNLQQLTFQKFGYDQGLCIKLFDIGGKLLQMELLTDLKNQIDFNHEHGTYIYTISQPDSDQEVGRGKFVY